MGILNVTPDSFSDGGLHHGFEAAVAHGRALFDQGADWVDVGGESTRPGAAPVDPTEEHDRVVRVVRALSPHGPVSVDTRRASVARAAIDAGATLINDVSGGADPAMLPFAAAAECGIVLMHMRGEPDTMQRLAVYDDVCADVWSALDQRTAAAEAAGVRKDRIVVDPGIGFAKTGAHNLALLRDLPRRTPGRSVLIGASRKRFIGELTGQPNAADRLEGSLAVALHARDAGAALIRVHDVAATVRALRVWEAIR
ncbi:MAG: dihydropteroate synthase [Pseudomonadota bacterium]|nr:dihydropteroate synthase [Pseudomonadota bacterium]